MSTPGRVYLVGAGPGDPGLLTLRARELISRAEVILFDHLVDETICEFFPSGAETIFVGKEGGTHYVLQEETIAFMVARAREGRMVVRLKGGDPFVFGRGGEEAEACAAAGIPFEVVPGVTAGIAAAAYAGIPVTHRDAAASLALITGHRRGDRPDLAVPVPSADTLVYYMGVKNLPEIAATILASGRAGDTPAAVIARGTTPRQRTVTGPLAAIAALAEKAGITPPAVLVVGEVVKYREKLNWYESRPLFGLTVLISRPRSQAHELRQLLAEKGAAVVSLPAIAIENLAETPALDQALARLEQYHYLVFTSVNGVSAFFHRLFAQGKDVRALAGLTTVCIGPRTAEELKKYHVNCDLLPASFVAEELLALFPANLAGRRVLIPRALEARDVLPEGLRARGAEVEVVPVYQTVGESGRVEIPEGVDIAVFTSSSAAEHFFARASLPPTCHVAAIGPVTAETLRQLGWQVDIEAREYTVPGLVRAIEEFIQRRK